MRAFTAFEVSKVDDDWYVYHINNGHQVWVGQGKRDYVYKTVAEIMKEF